MQVPRRGIYSNKRCLSQKNRTTIEKSLVGHKTCKPRKLFSVKGRASKMREE